MARKTAAPVDITALDPDVLRHLTQGGYVLTKSEPHTHTQGKVVNHRFTLQRATQFSLTILEITQGDRTGFVAHIPGKSAHTFSWNLTTDKPSIFSHFNYDRIIYEEYGGFILFGHILGLFSINK